MSTMATASPDAAHFVDSTLDDACWPPTLAPPVASDAPGDATHDAVLASEDAPASADAEAPTSVAEAAPDAATAPPEAVTMMPDSDVAAIVVDGCAEPTAAADGLAVFAVWIAPVATMALPAVAVHGDAVSVANAGDADALADVVETIGNVEACPADGVALAAPVADATDAAHDAEAVAQTLDAVPDATAQVFDVEAGTSAPDAITTADALPFDAASVTDDNAPDETAPPATDAPAAEAVEVSIGTRLAALPALTPLAITTVAAEMPADATAVPVATASAADADAISADAATAEPPDAVATSVDADAEAIAIDSVTAMAKNSDATDEANAPVRSS